MDDVAAAVVSGEYSSMESIAVDHPELIVRNGRGFEQLLSLTTPVRSSAVKVVYDWGPTGAGKTLNMYRTIFNDPTWSYDKSMDISRFDYVYILTPSAHSSGTTWWRGYKGQKVVVLEEFSSHMMSITTLTSIINPGPCQIPTFQGMTQMQATLVWILSNTAPKDLYPGVPTENRAALLRRLSDPNVGTVRFWGYGPNQDLAVCPCQAPQTCHLFHGDFSAEAIAVGAKLPPKDGFRKKPLE